MDDPLLSDDGIGSNIDSCSDDEDINCSNNNVPKLLIRRVVSEARSNLVGFVEVLTRRGKLWTTTGIVRQGKLFCHIEEAVFLVQRGALKLANSDDSVMSLTDLYGLLATGKHGCSWNEYLVYAHLKSLGYIIGRHKVPWTDTLSRVAQTQVKDDIKKVKDESTNLSESSSNLNSESSASSLKGHLPGSINIVDSWQERPTIEGDANQIAASDSGGAKMESCSEFANYAGMGEDIHKSKFEIPENKDSRQESALVERIANQLIFNENGSKGTNHASTEICHSPLQHAENNLWKAGPFSAEVDVSEIYVEANISTFNQGKDSKLPCTTCLYSDNNNDLLRVNTNSTNTHGELKLMFDVHLPNSRFKKTNPGVPAFSLCIMSDCPPQLFDLKWLEALNGGTPVKIASVDCGRVSFFSFDTVMLPRLA